MNMIEKVAKAMMRRHCSEFVNTNNIDNLYENWEIWKSSAIAAIEAMREPTERMIEELNELEDYRSCVDNYKIMIDGALKE